MMEITTIICVIVAAIIGAAITYFTLKKKFSTDQENAHAERVREAVLKNEEEAAEREAKIKEKYETLLAEAKTKATRLDEQLKECLNGHIDETIKVQLADAEKLKKKIKDLQEEIEENEDDLDDYKKKLKKRDEENNELQDELDGKTKESKRLKEELERANSELENKTNELNLKVESLYFVQEVLSAHPVNDTNTKELYNKVENIQNFVGGELRDCLNNIFGLEKQEEDYFSNDLNKWAITMKKSWLQRKTTIAFVGEFSAGKTSIVNRILSQDNPDIPRLPVSTKATTAIPTYISGGVSTRYNFVSPDNVQKQISEETFRRVNKEVLDQVKGVSSLIQYFVMTYNNENLNNLSILDTPGFNSNDKEDAERTIGVINECDALFWVFDVNAGTVNRASINLIKGNLKKPLFVVINKVDTKAESEVNKVEQLIQKTLNDEGVTVQKFLRFSAKAPLSDIMTPIQSITRDNTQDSYIDNLLEYVNQKEEQLNKSTQEANIKQTQLFKRCDDLVGLYNDANKRLGDDCQCAADIPHYEEHFFSKDKYEMSEYEYNKLIDVLNTICSTRVDELCDLYNTQMDAQRKAQQAHSDYIDEKVKWHDLNDCKEQLEKYINALKKS